MISACLIGIDRPSTEHIVAALARHGPYRLQQLQYGEAGPRERVDVVFAGGEPDEYLPLVAEVRQTHPGIAVIVIGQFTSTARWLDAIEAGAADYLATPPSERDILWALQSILLLRGIQPLPTPDTSGESRLKLVEAVQTALKRLNEAGLHICEVVADSPSSIPDSDGAMRVTDAGRAVRAAQEEQTRGTKPREELVINGKIPEDMTP